MMRKTFLLASIIFIFIFTSGWSNNDMLTGNINFENYMIQKITDTEKETERTELMEKKLRYLKAPEKSIPRIRKSIDIAHFATKYKPELIMAIMVVENPDFNPTAVSPKGYKGLMQTKPATGIPEVDTLHGAMEFDFWNTQAKGDMLKALAMYNGGFKYHNTKGCRKYANNVYRIYNELLKIER